MNSTELNLMSQNSPVDYDIPEKTEAQFLHVWIGHSTHFLKNLSTISKVKFLSPIKWQLFPPQKQ